METQDETATSRHASSVTLINHFKENLLKHHTEILRNHSRNRDQFLQHLKSHFESHARNISQPSDNSTIATTSSSSTSSTSFTNHDGNSEAVSGAAPQNHGERLHSCPSPATITTTSSSSTSSTSCANHDGDSEAVSGAAPQNHGGMLHSCSSPATITTTNNSSTSSTSCTNHDGDSEAVSGVAPQNHGGRLHSCPSPATITTTSSSSTSSTSFTNHDGNSEAVSGAAPQNHVGRLHSTTTHTREETTAATTQTRPEVACGPEEEGESSSHLEAKPALSIPPNGKPSKRTKAIDSKASGTGAKTAESKKPKAKISKQTKENEEEAVARCNKKTQTKKRAEKKTTRIEKNFIIEEGKVELLSGDEKNIKPKKKGGNIASEDEREVSWEKAEGNSTPRSGSSGEWEKIDGDEINRSIQDSAWEKVEWNRDASEVSAGPEPRLERTELRSSKEPSKTDISKKKGDGTTSRQKRAAKADSSLNQKEQVEKLGCESNAACGGKDRATSTTGTTRSKNTGRETTPERARLADIDALWDRYVEKLTSQTDTVAKVENPTITAKKKIAIKTEKVKVTAQYQDKSKGKSLPEKGEDQNVARSKTEKVKEKSTPRAQKPRQTTEAINGRKPTPRREANARWEKEESDHTNRSEGSCGTEREDGDGTTETQATKEGIATPRRRSHAKDEAGTSTPRTPPGEPSKPSGDESTRIQVFDDVPSLNLNSPRYTESEETMQACTSAKERRRKVEEEEENRRYANCKDAQYAATSEDSVESDSPVIRKRGKTRET